MELYVLSFRMRNGTRALVQRNISDACEETLGMVRFGFRIVKEEVEMDGFSCWTRTWMDFDVSFLVVLKSVPTCMTIMLQGNIGCRSCSNPGLPGVRDRSAS